MIWVAGRSPTLVSHSLRGVAMNLKATTLTYLAITEMMIANSREMLGKLFCQSVFQGKAHQFRTAVGTGLAK